MKKVLLSFDIEEFDMPLEYGSDIPIEKQIEVSEKGTIIILNILRQHQIKATFFSTVIFALKAPGVIKTIVDEGHELASHGYFHSRFEDAHLAESKEELTKISGQTIYGFRMPRMKAIDNEYLRSAGYVYNSSLNPVYLPGRYNNFFKRRRLFSEDSLIQFPASATPIIRFPLFWLSFHNLPGWLYQLACNFTINTDHYLNIYFHPWEFMDLRQGNYRLPKYVTKNSGVEMETRFQELIGWMKKKGYSFSTIINFLQGQKLSAEEQSHRSEILDKT